MTALPLAGMRVLELGSFIAVPYATALLASLGAEVIKLEPAPAGDPFRRGRDDEDPYFAQYNAGKLSLSVDLKSTEGLDLVARLLPTCDTFIHNLRPGKAEKLGLGAEQARAIAPRLAYLAVSGFGTAGPLVARPGYDSAVQSMAGLYSLLAPSNQVQAPGLPLADITTGVMAAIGLCAQLAGRARTGVGGEASTSLFEVALMLSTSSMANGSANRQVPATVARSAREQHYCLASADGRTVLIALGDSDDAWTSLMAALEEHGTPDVLLSALSYDRRVVEVDQVRERLQSRLGDLAANELVSLLSEHRVPATLARPYLEALEGSPVFAAGVLQDEPVAGIRLMRPGVSFDGARPRRSTAVPKVGAHTRELLGDLVTPEAMDDLASAGVVFWPEQSTS